MNLLRDFNHMRYLLLLLSIPAQAAFLTGNQDMQPGIVYASTFTAHVLRQSVVKSCSYGTTTDSNGGFDGCRQTNLTATVSITADQALGTVAGVCYATATLSSAFTGGAAIVSLQALGHNASANDKMKTAVLIDGAYPTPWSGYAGSQQAIGGLADGGSDTFAGFSVPVIGLAAGQHTFCIAAWREAGSGASLKCGSSPSNLPNCVLSVVTLK